LLKAVFWYPVAAKIVTLANHIQQPSINYACNGHCTVTTQTSSFRSATDAESGILNGVISNGEHGCDRNRTWSATEQDLNRVGRAVFVEIDLEAIADNCGILRAMCRNKNVGKYRSQNFGNQR
jgi:hypothetical protein